MYHGGNISEVVPLGHLRVPGTVVDSCVSCLKISKLFEVEPSVWGASAQWYCATKKNCDKENENRCQELQKIEKKGAPTVTIYGCCCNDNNLCNGGKFGKSEGGTESGNGGGDGGSKATGGRKTPSDEGSDESERRNRGISQVPTIGCLILALGALKIHVTFP